jgi:hypothetical protein
VRGCYCCYRQLRHFLRYCKLFMFNTGIALTMLLSIIMLGACLGLAGSFWNMLQIS